MAYASFFSPSETFADRILSKIIETHPSFQLRAGGWYQTNGNNGGFSAQIFERGTRSFEIVVSCADNDEAGCISILDHGVKLACDELQQAADLAVASELDGRLFAITHVEGGSMSRYDMSWGEIRRAEESENPCEWCISFMEYERGVKMLKVGQSMTFQPNRDDKSSLGIILRKR